MTEKMVIREPWAMCPRVYPVTDRTPEIKPDSLPLFLKAMHAAECRIVNDPPEGPLIVSATEYVGEIDAGSVYVKVIKRGEDVGRLL